MTLCCQTRTNDDSRRPVNVDFVGEDMASKLPAGSLFRNTSSMSSKLSRTSVPVFHLSTEHPNTEFQPSVT